MSQIGHSGPASPDPDETGSLQSRPDSRTSISSESMGMGDSSRITSTLDDTESREISNEAEKKNGKIMSSEDVIALDENAQSGGLLEEKNQLHRSIEKLKKSEKAFDSLELVSDEDMETGDSFRENCQNQNKEKLQSDFPLSFKDNELDFEGDPVYDDASKVAGKLQAKVPKKHQDEDSEEGECDDGTQDDAASSVKNVEEEKDAEELEEGEVSSDEDVGKHTRMEPRPVCRFYSKGNCTWGSNCRFVHPGVLDKGNYNMFAPARPVHANGPPPYDRPPFERPPHVQPPPEWVGIPTRPGPRMAARDLKAGDQVSREPENAESAWERGLRQAKEMLKKSNQRKETDVDFEEKRLNLGLGEEDIDKENDYYTRPASPVQKERSIVDDADVEPYPKYPPPPAERRIPSRYPPHLPPSGYPPPFEPRRGYGDPEFRDYYRGDPYDRPFYGQKRGERDYDGPYHPPGKLLPPPPPEKRWQDERYVEVNQASVQKGRADEWHDPWMRSKSPPVGPGTKSGRHRSYSSGSSISGSSSSSGSSSYSSSSRSSSRSSFSSRSVSRSRSRSPTPRGASYKSHAPRKGKRTGRSRKSATADEPSKSHSGYRPKPNAPQGRPISPADNYVSRKAPPAERIRGPPERLSPPRGRSWSSGSSRPRSRSPPSRQSQKRPVPGAKSQSRPRSMPRSSSSSSSYDSSSDSDRDGRRKRGRRDFAERKELETSLTRQAQPPLPPGEPTAPGKNRGTAESVKEAKQQIKLTLKSSAPTLKRVPNKFADDSDEEAKQNATALREKEKPAAPVNPLSSSAAGGGHQHRKRSAESPPEPPPSKVAAASSSPAKAGDKDKSKKATAVTPSRREELLKQLKAVEDAIARKRQKI